MKFSFVIPYRNRQIDRVKRCIDSLENQTYSNDYEIVLLDYGSLPHHQIETQKLCESYRKVRYHYVNTLGWFWSRSHAINLGVETAKGQYIIIVDIDLIFSPRFVEYLYDKANPNTFFQYRCYYLPENFTEYHKLIFEKPYPYEVSSEVGVGLLVVPKQALLNIQGFDNYFTIWGFEDMDMYHRLKKLNLELQWIELQQLTTFHQWHPKANMADSMPHSWLHEMRLHWENKTSKATSTPSYFDIFNAQRPAVQIWKNKQFDKIFRFEYPLAKSYIQFFLFFHQLKQGEALIVKQSFELIKENEKSRLAKLFLKANELLSKFKISYRLTELLTYEREIIGFFQVRDFIYYFIKEYSLYIEDYFIETKGQEELLFIVLKK
jgi:glycosyltransferase involved in cell wall biosynthesis